MNDFRYSKLSNLLGAILVPASIVYIILLLFVAVSRLEYPFELNWMEGGLLSVVERILGGQAVYTEPSLNYVPFAFTPFYFILSAIVAGATGADFMALRLVSLFSSLLCLTIIFLFVHRETNSKFAGFVSAGLFAAFFSVGGGWFDTGGYGPLNLFILLLALYSVRFFRNNLSYILAGILLFLAFLTTQFSIVLIVFLVAYSILFNRRAFIPLAGTTFILVVGSTYVLDWLTGSWYSYFVFDLPLRHGPSLSNMVSFWTEGLLRVSIVPIAFIALNLYVNQQSIMKNPGWRFNLFAAAGVIIMAWALRVFSVGDADSLLPALALVAILFGISMNDLLLRSGPKVLSFGNKFIEIAYFIIILQFISLAYNPFDLIPHDSDKAAGEEMVEKIKDIKGNVFIPSHGYLARKAGKEQFAHSAAINEILNVGAGEAGEKFQEDITRAFKDEKFSAVIYDNVDSPLRKFDSDENYVFERLMLTGDSDFRPLTGTPGRPQYFFGMKNPPIYEFADSEIIGPMPSEEEKRFWNEFRTGL